MYITVRKRSIPVETTELVVIHGTTAYAKRVSFCVAQGGRYTPGQ
jgi:hypothetical protein